MSRDRTLLHPELNKKLDVLIEKCEASGLRIKITDTVRTRAEQDALYAQGRTAAGAIVTSVKYPNSMHNWGIAADFCRNDGKGAYNDTDEFFTKVGEIAESIGLEWGGRWKSFVDKPHLQMSGWGSTPKKLVETYGTPEKYMSSWKGSVASSETEMNISLPTIRKGSGGLAVKLWQAIVGVEADGIFGGATERATISFQNKNGLAVDGIVGKNSWKAGLKEFVR
jgi:peptidoglycan L-alanyl-D-glutamate endopeptidase CwlK